MKINSKVLSVSTFAAGVVVATSSSAEDAAEFDASVLEALPGMGSASPVLGSNIDGGSVFTNYIQARKEHQFFWVWDDTVLFEQPSSSRIGTSSLLWCSNIQFTDVGNTNTTHPVVGYTAHCVVAVLQDSWAELNDAGWASTHSLASDEFSFTTSLSAVYVPQTNIFEGVLHGNSANFVARFWDDGRLETSLIGWEVHEEGDTHPNAAITSWSGAGKFLWTSVEEAASLLGNDSSDFTPDTFEEIYKEVWSINPEHAATLSTETDSSNSTEEAEKDEGASTAVTEGAGGSVDSGDTVEENPSTGDTDDSSSGGRRLSAIPGMISALLGYF